MFPAGHWHPSSVCQWWDRYAEFILWTWAQQKPLYGQTSFVPEKVKVLLLIPEWHITDMFTWTWKHTSQTDSNHSGFKSVCVDDYFLHEASAQCECFCFVFYFGVHIGHVTAFCLYDSPFGLIEETQKNTEMLQHKTYKMAQESEKSLCFMRQ